MIAQFLPTLVLVVIQLPKRLRVRDVNGNRHVQLAAAFPHRVELRVINLDQLAAAVLEIQAEALELLQARRAEAMPFLHLRHRARAEIRRIPARVVEIHVVNDAPRRERVRHALHVLEGRQLTRLVRHVTAAQVHRHAHAHAIHDTHRAREMLRGAIQVLMQINDAMLRAPVLGLRAPVFFRRAARRGTTHSQQADQGQTRAHRLEVHAAQRCENAAGWEFLFRAGVAVVTQVEFQKDSVLQPVVPRPAPGHAKRPKRSDGDHGAREWQPRVAVRKHLTAVKSFPDAEELHSV